MVDIIAINRAQRVALTDDGKVCKITDMIDVAGELTDDVEDAVCAVVCVSPTHWATITLADFERQSVH
jgi:hypothetical protein